MKPIDRNAILIFDEVSIGSLLSYDSKEDEIKGLADFGSGKRCPKIADYASVFMIKGMFRQWKQPICFTFRLRNNFLTKDLHFKVSGKAFVAKWSHIEQLYFLDTEDQELRLCPKLTDEHVLKNKIKKMRVSCCTQVFSNQVGVYMKKILSWNAPVNLEREAEGTANLILFFDKLFDSLNSSKKFGSPGKPLKAGVTKESTHISFWYDALKILETMKYELL
ncbi:uncharacterized protein LOC126744516 [Anthonomus grandis grandis]|uniref:uncharacterized protein LOC126744516 n=1 Tax=Anthonomus grandis grandis TaxID=2921223 RepID=UPI0021664919|nr:uncharacterized protein LOC126744516 [Anthonomus grandis grandis]